MTPPATAADSLPAVELRLRADHAVLRPDGVLLEGKVVVSADRWRLLAERLQLTPDGPSAYRITGPLTLQPCACTPSPLSLGVGEARVQMADDQLAVVSLRRTTVRLAGLPVLYLPWWQLRSERHWGLLPPRVALRAHDGLLVGAGVHAPLGPGAWLQLEPAAYLRGGHELLARLRAPGGDLALRWDHRPAGDLVALQGEGRLAPPQGVLTWSIDAQRGPLDRVLALDDAARVRDRARAALLVPWVGSFAAAVRAVAPRGEGSVVVGPQATWAGSVSDGSLAWIVDASQLARQGQGLTSVLRAEVDAARAWWWGPWRLRPALQSLGALLGRPDGVALEGAALASVRVEAPLVRDGDEVRNRLEPGVWLGALASGVSAGHEPWARPPALPGLAVLGALIARTAWSWPSGAVISVRRSGGLALSDAGLQPVARQVAAADRGSLHALIDLSAASLREGTLSAVAAAGTPDGWRLDLRLDGQLGRPGPLARLLDGASPWSGAWYDAPGWSTATGLEAPLGASWRAAGRLFASLDERGLAWLGHSLGLLYANACGCLHAGLTAAQRRGREGVDVMASLGLGAPAGR